jgi:hypothetical protein
MASGGVPDSMGRVSHPDNPTLERRLKNVYLYSSPNCAKIKDY